MQDAFCRRFCLAPQQTLHRRSEAVRAVVVAQPPQLEVAKRCGYPYATRRRLVRDLRAQGRPGQAPPFAWLHRTGDLLGHPKASTPLARSKLSGRMPVACHCSQDAADGPASQAFSSFARCWPNSSALNA